MKRYKIVPLEERILLDAAVAAAVGQEIAAALSADAGVHAPHIIMVPQDHHTAGDSVPSPHEAVVVNYEAKSSEQGQGTPPPSANSHQDIRPNEISKDTTQPTQENSPLADSSKDNLGRPEIHEVTKDITPLNTTLKNDSVNSNIEEVNQTNSAPENPSLTLYSDSDSKVNIDTAKTSDQTSNMSLNSTMNSSTTDDSSSNDMMFMSMSFSGHDHRPEGNPDTYEVPANTVFIVPAPGVLANDGLVHPSISDVQISENGGHGTLRLNSNGSFTFTPDPGFTGTITYNYKVQAEGYHLDSNPIKITFHVVADVNDAPSFTKGPNQIVNEDAGAQTVEHFATNISAGPANEANQTVNFIVSNDNTSLFSTQPSISSNGTLTYTLAPNAFGTATVFAQIHDSGGTSHGGVDTSAIQTFTITANPVNDVPSFTHGPSQTINEGAGPQSINGFITNIKSGPSNEAGQTVDFIVSNDNNSLFSEQPSINAAGKLTYTLAADAFGTANVSVKIHDSGGTSNGGIDTSAAQTFTITANPVNDAPSFAVGPNQTVNEGAGAQSVNGFVTQISKGPANEGNQTIDFIVTNDKNSLFSVQPSINADGKLTYTLAADAFGTATVTVKIHDNGGTSNGGVDTSAAQTFTITANSVNDAPRFTIGPDQTINEGAGPQSVNCFITQISKGPANEANQTIDFIVTNDNNSLFSVQPSINADGKLTYTLAADAFGTAIVSVKIHDNGGTSNGGIDTSAAQTFTITAKSVNDAPSFTKGPDQTVNEDAGAQTVNNFITNISSGPANEAGQTVNFIVTNDNNSLFSVQPSISANGKLTYTLAPDAFGTATVTVKIHDSGGTSYGGVDTSAAQTFTITVKSVNDAPSFSVGPNQIVSEDAGAQSVNNFITNISKGPANEATQSVNFIVSNDNNALFDVQPFINSDGKLTYTLAPDAIGLATITVRIHDNGGTIDGGVDTSQTQTFTITAKSINDAPSFTKGPDQTVNEDAGAQTVNNFITNISKGPANEASQSVDFIVSNDNNALFDVQPFISSDGKLTYTLARDAFGTATVTVKIHDSGGTSDGGIDTSTAQTFTITAKSVNDAPSFTNGINQTVNEDASPQDINNFITQISKGPANEADQSIDFIVSNSNNGLFDVQPYISSDGKLTYTLAPDAFGTATISVQIRDSGGTSDGGVNTSAVKTFTITVNPVNDAPSFNIGGNQTVNEDASPQAVSNFTTFSPGPANEAGQSIIFIVSNDNNSLFTVQPFISSTGQLTYTLAPDAFGSATISVQAQDNGGTTNGGINTSSVQTFSITVNPVNDAPTFNIGGNQTVNEGSGAQTVDNFVTNISGGPNESQAVNFSVSNDNNGLFTVQPTITPNGQLTYTLAPNTFGTATITVQAVDSGGATVTQTFTINVAQTNTTPPAFVAPSGGTVAAAGIHDTTFVPKQMESHDQTGQSTGFINAQLNAEKEHTDQVENIHIKTTNDGAQAAAKSRDTNLVISEVPRENQNVVDQTYGHITTVSESNYYPTLPKENIAKGAYALTALTVIQQINPLELNKRGSILLPTLLSFGGIAISKPDPMVTYAGSELNLQINLKSMPSAKVIVRFKSSNENLGIVVPSKVEFDHTNWYIKQDVVVKGVGGVGGERYEVQVLPAESRDKGYRELEVNSLPVIVKPPQDLK